VSIAEFWDHRYESSDYSRQVDAPIIGAALAWFGDVRGKVILEIGCGPGAYTRHFAALGARVIAVDVSERAIADLSEACAQEGITGVRAVCRDVAEPGSTSDLGPVDFVFGSMILHHIEPFERLASELRSALRPGGRAFFYENNATSNLLVWFRQHVVGRLWVPKEGDPEEFPFTPQEVDELRRHFSVSVVYPELLLFRLAGIYLLRGRLMRPFDALDRLFYRRSWLLHFSYRQYLHVQG
jgi:SAM-dependent methyltransferase